MKKSIFIISLFFIIGFPFSAQAVQSASPQKATYPLEVFSKKQKKLNFFQRVILKKIKRKIARHNGKKKLQPAIPKENLANQSLFFGLGSLLAILGTIVIISSTNLGLGAYAVALLDGIIVTVLAMIALIKGVIFFRRKNDKLSENRSSNRIAKVGIFLGIIGLLAGVLAFSLVFI